MIDLRQKASTAVIPPVRDRPSEGLDFHAADLRDADLRGASLAGARFSHALLAGADLRGASLSGADLARAYLRGANLSGADLRGADLSGTSLDSASCVGADLARADLTGAFMAGACLRRARLTFASLHLAYLGGADLSGARLGFTLLVRCGGLDQVSGLGEVEHLAPSSLDSATLRQSLPGLPDAFLRGVGFTRAEIRRLRSGVERGRRRRSVRVAYAEADAPFGERLVSDLRERDLGCWRDRRDLGGGYFVQVLADRDAAADEIVLVCSGAALPDGDLAEAAARAIERERETARQALFPVVLDDEVAAPEALSLADAKIAGREWREDWVRYVEAHPALDFRAWREDTHYRRALRQLLRALARPATRALAPRRMPLFPR